MRTSTPTEPKAKHTGPQGRLLDVLSTGDTTSPLATGRFARTDRLRQKAYRVEPTRLGALQARALADGATRPTEGSAEWDVAGRGKQRCILPRSIDLMKHQGDSYLVPDKAKHMSRLYLKVRCRICEPCLKARGSYWKLAAMREIVIAQRTWFLTLTFGEDWRLRARYSADLRLAKAGIEKPCAKDIFAARLKELGPEVTRFLKRLRKNSKSSFRYLLIWEDHKCECEECEPLPKSLPGHYGFPHAHLLLHEKQGQTVPWSDIDRSWNAGFHKSKLVQAADPKEIHKKAAYICKYLSKSMLSRVRASLGYGSTVTEAPTHSRGPTCLDPDVKPLADLSDPKGGVAPSKTQRDDDEHRRHATHETKQTTTTVVVPDASRENMRTIKNA